MKKSDIILIVSVVLIIIASSFVSAGGKREKVSLKGETGYTEINYEEYNDLLKSKDYFVINVVRTGCSYCEKFKPVVEKVVKKLDIPFYYIDIANLNEEEMQEFTTSNSFLENNEWGTPTTLILNKDKVVGSSQGYVEANKLESFIKKYVKLDGEK